MNEEQKTVKEFADELNMDKKQLQNKLNYWKKKGAETWNFSDTFSDGVRTLTNQNKKGFVSCWVFQYSDKIQTLFRTLKIMRISNG